jgi:hypothetical protein
MSTTSPPSTPTQRPRSSYSESPSSPQVWSPADSLSSSSSIGSDDDEPKRPRVQPELNYSMVLPPSCFGGDLDDPVVLVPSPAAKTTKVTTLDHYEPLLQ